MPLIQMPISSTPVSEVDLGGRQGALGDHHQAVADLEQLVQLLGDHQDRRAGVAQVEQGPADERGRADVHAPGGLGQHQQLGLLHDLAAHDELLQVAAGKRLGFGVRRRRTCTSNRWMHSSAKRLAAPQADHAAEQHALAVGGEQDVLGEGQARHRAAAQALLGHEAHAQAAAPGRVHAGPPGRRTPAPRLRRGTGSSPEMALSSSCWPLPETPAMPTISPLRTSRWMFLRLTPNGSSVGMGQPVDAQPHFAALGRARRGG